MDIHAYDDEVDRNYDAFASQLSKLLLQKRGQYVLMRGGQIDSFHASDASALHSGHEKYGNEPFSIQEVTDRPVDLGFFSHAIDTRIA